ncbi:outer membrane protein assembly factor [Flagellimonas taeanensis]|uniref:translocation and assembly module lipoprotein TamL n=1 Tax=Flavobacteriaceae TaxID=49546 RepID=UPI000E691CE7|nr:MULTISPECIES: BamA/TamA family outer membrane protein [Allomuricauda]MDC6384309.1 BamA/TamA family outer membrane protein [Muricauda sp. SK9]MEE1962391.1 BamA/TamA family outer membrane protein [Allomuricauda taeanensis]RIV49664.1 outer membrane protein assembly factor [Allomuricauda taeanensis]RIV53863.1 outer membrane protein assembly factor [Allomuricauda taeanensis]
MRGSLGLMGNWAKIGLLLLMLSTMGCNTLKKVGEDELLLTKNSIYVNEEKVSTSEIKGLISQKPNSSVLGYPLRLNLYNLAKENPDSSFQDWLHRKEKREKRLNNLLSQKQVSRLQESFIVKGASEFLERVGEPPVVIDTSLTRKSVERLEAYYNSKGYFNNNGSYEIVEGKRKKRAEVEYNINLNKPYIIDTVQKNITSPELDSIYTLSARRSFVKQGEQFDLDNFTLERERLTTLFRNSGVYNFQESSINYDILRDTIKNADDQLMDVQLNIKKFRSTTDSSDTNAPYRIARLKKINIYADYAINGDSDSLKTLEYDNYTIHYHDKLRYRPKALTDAIFFQKDSIYRDLDRIRTYRQITNLNTFKYPNIEFIADSTQTELISNIYLAAKPKFSLNLNFDVTHSNIQQVGTAFSTSVITRNVFGGAETLNISARGSIGLLSDASLSNETFTSELGGDINITFPRIWFPFNTESIIPGYMLPQSRLLAGTNFQRNIGLDKQSLNSILSYNWSPTDRLKNNIELLNVEFVRNVNPDNFYNVYRNTFSNLDNIADDFQNDPQFASFYETVDNTTDSLRLNIPEGANEFVRAVLNNEVPVTEDQLDEVNSIAERRRRLTDNNLIFASNFTHTKNSKSGINDNDFYQYRIKLESAGNVLSLMSNIVPYNKNDNGQLLVFGVPFSQYIKSELDYIRHWEIGDSQVIAFRSFFGMAVPYGNSDNIPFVRSYFAGGSNDNRAWNAYELGPGKTSNINDFNEANLKLAFNVEYRFPIAGDVKGALFADAGNIWNVFDNESNPDAIFQGISSLGDIALGTGLGLRYDFTYFVFRLDVGFKTYNPARVGADRWFNEYNIRNAVLNIGINYPF